MHRKTRTLEGCKNKNKKRSGHYKTKKQTKSLPYFDRSYMYVGIDVHKEFLQVAMMDKKGKIVFNERVDRDNDEVKKFFLKNVPKSAKCIIICLVWLVYVHDKRSKAGCISLEPIPDKGNCIIQEKN
ncbi:MAG: hypothetical protein K8823_1087 [Cenarchaeum symbiont of Oopsacas minuta]|nr:hypothetical protein [Cenarchaeum symbiont of Oopsacas minuta]